jgi:hypothetical protein
MEMMTANAITRPCDLLLCLLVDATGVADEELSDIGENVGRLETVDSEDAIACVVALDWP